jgi:starch synthase
MYNTRTMAKEMRVLFLAAEALPFIKIGGLGDVAGSLPLAIHALNDNESGDYDIDIRIVLPFHPVLRSKALSLRPVAPFVLGHEDGDILVQAFETTSEGVTVYFIGGGPIDASGSVYSSNAVLDGEKYTFFSLAALELTKQIGWHPDILHANDWHTALALYGSLVQFWKEGYVRPASLLSLHNLPFLGPDVDEILQAYQIPLAQTDLPGWARKKPLPLGLWAADKIVAVSPTYAHEILTPEYSAGLEDFLTAHRKSVIGILNGLDVDSFSPMTDQEIVSNFSGETLELRSANKFALTKQTGLSTNLDIPLFGMVSRMEPQKGIDLVIGGLRKLGEKVAWQAVLLGAGDPQLEKSAHRLAKDFPDRVYLQTNYDAGFSRKIYAGADVLLMPSRYEPCGLSQMIAMRYGCVPLVRATGGLHDTVTDGETGFVFVNDKMQEFVAAMKRACSVYKTRETWMRLQLNGMSQDFSWNKSALEYGKLYQRLLLER